MVGEWDFPLQAMMEGQKRQHGEKPNAKSLHTYSALPTPSNPRLVCLYKSRLLIHSFSITTSPNSNKTLKKYETIIPCLIGLSKNTKRKVNRSKESLLGPRSWQSNYHAHLPQKWVGFILNSHGR